MAYYIWPVPGFPRVTSGYRTAERPAHNGIDIGRNLSPPAPIESAVIVAAADGHVLTAQWHHASWGHWVEIAHGDGIRTRYAHCMELLVKPGQDVRQGQAIALVGSTGRSTGPHLHFEVLYNGRQVDPLEFVSPYRQAPAAGDAFSPETGRDAAAGDGRGAAKFLPRGLPFLILPAFKFLTRLFGRR